MRLPQVNWWAGPLVAAGFLLAGASRLTAAEATLVGNWKVLILSQGQEIAVWLVKVGPKDAKGGVTLLSAGLPNFKESKLTKSRVEPNALHLTFQVKASSFEVAGYVPQGEENPKVLYGTVHIGGQTDYARWERTNARELIADSKKAVKESPAFKEYARAEDEEGEAQVKAFKEIQDRYPTDPLAISAGIRVFDHLIDKGTRDAALRVAANRILKTAALYGPDITREQTVVVAGLLLPSNQHAALALAYARQAEKVLPASAPAAQQVPVLKTLALALKQTGRKDEAARIEEHLVKLDEVLDREFAKTAVPFKPAPYTGRKTKSDRVVLVELFTGAQCPPCVGADVAFDAGLQTYKPSEVVFLQYHLHVPGPDPLTNKDSEARAEYYGDDVSGTPTMLVDGKVVPELGGSRSDGEDSYDKLRHAGDEELEKKPGAQVKLTVQRKGSKVVMAADVSGLARTGENVRLRFVLVEAVAHYAGGNGQRLHHHVVRAMPGGPRGIALPKETDRQTVMVDLKDLAKALDEYLAGEKFEEGDRRLPLKDLKVIAFVQDDKTRAILQAAQAGVPAEVR